MEYEFLQFEVVGSLIVVGIVILLSVAVFFMLRDRQPRDHGSDRDPHGPRAPVVRRRLDCPVKGEEAEVHFRMNEGDGEAYMDVVGCSLFAPDEEVGCGKTCRSSSTAPFARPDPVAP